MDNRYSKGRKTGFIKVFGIRAVIEAIEAGKAIDKIIVKRDLKGDTIKELRSLADQCEIPVQYVPSEKFKSINNKNHQGVYAFLSQIDYSDLNNMIQTLFEQGETPLIWVLDSITDVRNFGAIARSAECFGVNTLVIPNKNTAQINADAIKTSAGALHKIPVCRTANLTKSIKFLQESGLTVYAASEKAEKNISDYDLTTPTAVVMGSEDVGVDTKNIKQVDFLTKIPMSGTISSLNVSVAAGIMMYECLKQRNKV